MRSILSVQVLRAVAAISVTMCHFNSVALMLTGRGNDPVPLYPLASGVDLFFVISGFIMVYSSEALFAASGGAFVFLRRRLTRIVPLYWVTTPLAIYLMELPVDWQKFLGSYFFIPYQNEHGTIAPLNGVAWTLNFEMFFYALFALALFWPRKIAVPLLCGVFCCIAFLGYKLAPTTIPPLFWSDSIILEFTYGMIIALLYIEKIHLPGWLCWLMIAGAAGAVWFSAPHMPPSGNRALTWGVPAAMIVAGAVLSRQTNRAGRVASFMRLIGDASYSIYLLHPLAGAIVLRTWHRGLNHFPVIVVMTAALVMTIAISMASFWFFERRTTKALQRLEGRAIGGDGDEESHERLENLPFVR